MVESEEIFAKEDEYHLSMRGRVSEIENERYNIIELS